MICKTCNDEKVAIKIYISKTIDEALRKHLGKKGLRRGALSEFVEEAILEKLRKEEGEVFEI